MLDEDEVLFTVLLLEDALLVVVGWKTTGG